jgi:Domain of unknown function (DUF4190)
VIRAQSGPSKPQVNWTARHSPGRDDTGAVGLFFWCWVIPGIVSIVLGHLALESIENSGGAKRGRGMAIAGILLGWVGIGIVGLLVLVWFVAVLTI